LEKKGYTTACIGKWHLGLGYRDSTDFYSKISPGPIELGFDYFYGISGSLNMRPFCFIRNHYTDGYLSVEKSPYNYPQQKGMMVPGWRDEQVDVAFVEEASRFIAEHRKQPFFVYLALSAPHTPHVQPYFIKNKSDAGPRGDMVLEVDWAVGQIRKNLERFNLLENTVIIITSDNGAEERNYDRETRSFTGPTYGHKSNYIFRGQKADIFEGGHRVPFIVSWPGMIPEGQQTDKILCFTDIFPTIAGLFNESLPEDTGEDGFNLWPVWQNPSNGKNQRNHLVMHSARGVFAIRKGPWKLIMSGTSGGFGGTRASEGRFRAETPGQLYHLENDVREQNNVYSEYPEIVNELTRLLQQIKMQGYSQIMD
jgi:arylsulfatase A-like enzyme